MICLAFLNLSKNSVASPSLSSLNLEMRVLPCLCKSYYLMFSISVQCDIFFSLWSVDRGWFFFFSFSRAHKTENKKPTTKFVRWQMRKLRKRGSVLFAFPLRNGVERLRYICFYLCVCLCVMSFRGNLNGSFCKQIQSWNHLEMQRLWKMITHLVL